MERITYAHGAIADTYHEVTSARIYGHEVVVGGDNRWGARITRIVFYTGFAGCPARYFITTERTPGRVVTTQANATGLHERGEDLTHGYQGCTGQGECEQV